MPRWRRARRGFARRARARVARLATGLAVLSLLSVGAGCRSAISRDPPRWHLSTGAVVDAWDHQVIADDLSSDLATGQGDLVVRIASRVVDGCAAAPGCVALATKRVQACSRSWLADSRLALRGRVLPPGRHRVRVVTPGGTVRSGTTREDGAFELVVTEGSLPPRIVALDDVVVEDAAAGLDLAWLHAPYIAGPYLGVSWGYAAPGGGEAAGVHWVVDVVPGSPAAGAGLEPGDVIEGVGAVQAGALDQRALLERVAAAADPLRLHVRRCDARFETSVHRLPPAARYDVFPCPDPAKCFGAQFLSERARRAPRMCTSGP